MAAGNNVAVLALNPAGLKIAKKLAGSSADFIIYAHRNIDADGCKTFSAVAEAVEELFEWVDGFVFIMAAGIAVRTLAPRLRDKMTDPGAVVVDENGDNVISLVGGHEGGANALAYRVAGIIGGRPIITTGSETRKGLTVGVGCRRGSCAPDIRFAVEAALASVKASPADVKCLATLDVKQGESGLLEAAEELGLPIVYFSASDLKSRGGWTEISGPATRAFGIGGICEPAALCADRDNNLISPKKKYNGVTIAIAARKNRLPGLPAESDDPVWNAPVEKSETARGAISLIGLGQSNGLLSAAALEALEAATDVVGYKTYMKSIKGLVRDQTIHESGMGKELDRARFAVELAGRGRRVAVISSGDSGIYGMAGPVLEVLSEADIEVDVKVVPGVTAANAAAAAVGAPLMNDFAVISLSDLLTPWNVIAERLSGSAAADLVIVLYNPKSRGRREQFGEACRLIGEYRAGTTPAAVVRNAGDSPEIHLTTLDDLPAAPADMRSTVIIGNSQSEITNGWFITKRGYRL